jgi:hypothetical protein
MWVDTDADPTVDSRSGTTIRWTLPGSDDQKETI